MIDLVFSCGLITSKELRWRFLLTMCIVSIVTTSDGQLPHSSLHCHFDEFVEHLIDSQPSYRAEMDKFEKHWRNYLSTDLRHRKTRYTLPVVVHVVHDNGSENIFDLEVIKSIQYLNEAFSNSGYFDPTTGVDIELEFCLAVQDPDGNNTTGINRIESGYTELDYVTEDEFLKGLIHWDPLKYINIYVVREIHSDLNHEVAGYAYYPFLHGSNSDGIVVEPKFMTQYRDHSALLVHEMGHYLGLFHTFQGGCKNNDCRMDGDRVCDTPPDGTKVASPCDNEVNSCATDTDDASVNNPFRATSLGGIGDQSDEFQNYMDYSFSSCQDRFTIGQKERMFFFLEQVRSSLLSSKACNDPCVNKTDASFVADRYNINIGETVNFTNQSSGAIEYKWYYDGIFFNSGINPSFAFSEDGNYPIVLEAISDNPNCYSSFDTVYISVICNVDADFKYELRDSFEISLYNESVNATSIEYKIYDKHGDIIYSSNESNLKKIINEPGSYGICMTAMNNTCVDEKCIQITIIDYDVQCKSSSRAIIFQEKDKIVQSKTLRSGHGGFYFVYLHDLDVVVRHLDENLNILWSKSILLASNGNDSRSLGLLYEDSEGYILINVRSGTYGNSALIKFNPYNRGVDWIRNLENYGVLFHSAHEENFSYLLMGQRNGCEDGFILRVQKSLGTIWVESRFSYGDCMTFNTTLNENGEIFMCGGAGNTRTFGLFSSFITKIKIETAWFSHIENYIWSKRYTFERNPRTKQQINNVKIDQDKLICVGRRSKIDSESGDISGLFFRTDLDGSPIDGLEVRPINSEQAWFVEVLKRENKFFAFGNYLDREDNQYKIYVTRFSKDGNVEKLYSLDVGVSDHNLWMSENQVYMLGDYFIIGGDFGNGAFVLKIDLQNLENNDCINIKEMEPDITEFQNIFADEQTIGQSIEFYQNNGLGISSEVTNPSTAIDFKCYDSEVDIELNIESDTICVPYGSFNEIGIQWCLKHGEFNSNGAQGVIINGSIHSDSLNVLDTFDLGSIYSLDSCFEIGYNVTNEMFDQGKWHYVLLNYKSNPGWSTWQDGFPYDLIQECNYINNIDSFYVEFSPLPPNLGEDLEVCDNQVFLFELSDIYEEYKWSDGTSDSFYTAYTSGIHWVEVVDHCGNIYKDSVLITYKPLSQVDLGPNLTICKGEEIELIPNITFSNYLWYPDDHLSCKDCDRVVIRPDSSLIIYLIVDDDKGCYSTDSIKINVVEFVSVNDTYGACKGDTVLFRGHQLVEEGFYLDSIILDETCDTFFYLDLSYSPNYMDNFRETICKGDSILFNNEWIFEEGNYEALFQSNDGCDSLIFLEVNMQTPDTIIKQKSLCEGDSIWLNGQLITDAGMYEQVDRNFSCDSLKVLDVDLLDTSYTFINMILCEDDSVKIADLWIKESGEYSFLMTNQFGCDSLLQVSVEEVMFDNEPEWNINCSSNEIFVNIVIDDDLEVEWSNGDTTFHTKYHGGESIWVTASKDSICEKRITMILPELPDINSLPNWRDSIAFKDEVFTIELGLNSNKWRVNWTPSVYFSCDTCMITNLIYTNDTEVELTLEHNSGCIFEYLFNIDWKEKSDLYIPNSFSPNGDGRNDFWQVHYNENLDVILKAAIYSPWGSEIKEWKNTKEIVWDGTHLERNLNSGVFVYYIKYITIDGHVHLISGDITLIGR